MCCGVVPILFGWFLSVPSLHVLVFLWKTFLDFLYPTTNAAVVQQSSERLYSTNEVASSCKTVRVEVTVSL